MTWIGWILTRLLAVIGVVVVIAIVALAILGYTATGNQFLANQIAGVAATPDMQIRIDGVRGLLAGRLRIDKISVADTQGQFAEASDVAIDWSPLSLFGARFQAERIVVATIDLQRMPVQTVENAPSDSQGFSLPVEIDIRKLDLPSLSLGKDIVGKRAELALSGSAQGAADRLALTLDAKQTDAAGIRAVADLVYAVNARTLKLAMDVSEPKGGLIATLLKLPDNPALDISVTGDGPLDGWAGKIRAKLDGIERLALDGSHVRSEGDIHQIVLSGGGAVGDLMPPALRSLFEGETAVDVDASFAANGMLDIRSAKLTNGSLSLDIGGSVDPQGQATLNGSLRPVGEVLAFRWPLAEGVFEADIRNASLTASGPYQSVAFEIGADLARVAVPAGELGDIVFRLGSDSFDLATRNARIDAELASETATFVDPQVAKLVRGPIKVSAPITISGPDIKAETIEVSSGAIGGTAALAYNLDSSLLDLAFKAAVASQALLPAELAAKAGDVIRLSGSLSGTPDNLAFKDIRAESPLATAKLDGTLAGKELSASLTAEVPSLSVFADTIDGHLGVTATATGPLDAPKIASAVTSQKIAVAGRAVENLDLTFDGQVDAAGPGGLLSASFALDGESVTASTNISRRGDVLAFGINEIKIGGNTLGGTLQLGPDMLPSGDLAAKLPDLTTLGRLAGQPLEGDLELAIRLEPADGKLGALITGSGSRIAAQGTVLESPTLRFESPDLIAQLVKGELKVASLTAGGNTIGNLALTVDHMGNATAVTVNGQLDGAPLAAAAEIQQGPAGIDIMLRDLVAAPRGLPVRLAEPGFVLIRNGGATIESLRIALDSGLVAVSGTAGENLDIDIVATRVPASLANRFSPGLDASGTIDATASVTGTAASPVVSFELAGAALTAQPLKDAGRKPLDIAGKGRFENNLLTTDTTISGIEETGELALGAGIRLDGPEIRIEKLDIASEAVTGNLTGRFQTATQALQADFQFDVTGARLLPADMQAKLTTPVRLTGKIAGTPADLAFTDIKLASNLVTADLSGSLKAGVIDAALRGTLPDLSSLQPDSSGTASFTATATGPLATPSIVAEVKATDAMLAGRVLQSLSAKLNAVADPAAPKGRLTASGTIDGQTIDISGDITSDQGLFAVPDLKAVIGRNTLTANLALDKAFLPSGTLRFDLPDIGLLAALGGQTAEGDLKGEATLDNSGGRLSARIRAEGTGISSAGFYIQTPSIDLDIPDLLTGQLSGTVTAAELAAGANRLANLDATFALDGPKTDFDVSAIYDDAPLKLDGAVLRSDGALAVTLDTFTATPRKLPVALAAPATIRIAGGATDLGTIAIDAAGGRIQITGTVADTLDLKIDAPALPLALANIVAPDLAASGALDVKATISGTSANPVADFTLDGKALTARPLQDAARDPLDIKASGRFENNSLTARADIAGIRELGPTKISAKVALKDGSVVVDAVTLRSAALTADGDAVLQGETLALRLSGEIVELATFLPQAKGRAGFTIEADGPLAALPLKLRLEAENAVMAGKTLERLVVDATAVADPARPTAKITATGAIDGQKIDISTELVTADGGKLSIPAIKANVGRNTITGAIELSAKYLPTGKLDFNLPDIALLAALGGQVADGQLTGSIDLAETEGRIRAAIKATGSGVTAQGIRINKPDIDLTIPDLLTGQISGRIRAADVVSGANRLAGLDTTLTHSGTTTEFDVKGNYDGAPLTVAGALEQKPEGMVVTLDSFAASPRKIPVKLSAPVSIATGGDGAVFKGLKIATGNGSITVDGVAGNRLDLKIKVTALPASLANSFASGLDAGGTIAADASVTGTSANPLVNFSVSWQNAITSQVRAAGLSALTINAKGKLEGSRLSIDTNVRGGGGLTLNAQGSVETSGNQALNLSVKGQLPFAAIAGQLAAQGLALKGNANFDLKIGGNASRPAVSGRINTANAQFIVVRQNLIVNNVAATVTLSGQTATISSLSGNLAGGGKVSASGTVGFAPGSGLPADITVKLDRATYADGRVVVAKVTGELTVKGPLQRDAVLGGTIRLRRADITIPERLPASLANANVKHKNAPADVVRQSKEIRSNDAGKADTDKGGGMRLDLKLIANRQIFVRGRGLDAELGGEVRIMGPSSAPSVSGGFKMVRGRLGIIGKRLDFTTGEITFGGGLVPYLNMIASTTVNARTLNVNVTGLANDPAFSFTASPALPQDEVLAQLIFGRESSSLSAFQIAQLADAVATLSGGQRTSLFNKLRQGLGVDDLNVGTDENGGAQVTAGKYLNKRTYIELKQGQDATKSGVAINLDIGKGVKLRGEATADGNTSTGIFYEKEY